jgi:predicted RNA-binding Zn-ribbon protein involved in translation (DUF1610 family)
MAKTDTPKCKTCGSAMTWKTFRREGFVPEDQWVCPKCGSQGIKKTPAKRR